VPEMVWLHEQGAKLWYDEGLGAGSVWRDELADAIERSSALLYFATPASVASENCLREIDLALSLGRTIITVVLAGTQLTSRLLFRIGNVQSIQADASDLRSVRDQVAAAIDRVISRRPAPSSMPPPPAQQAGQRIGIVVTADAAESDRASAADLAASIARYIGWVGGAYRAIGSMGPHAGVGRIGDYRAVVHMSSFANSVRITWEVLHETSGEVIGSGRHAETSEDYQARSEQIADMVAESIVGSVRANRLDQIQGSAPDSLGYWDLLLRSTVFTGMRRENIEERINLIRRALEQKPNGAHAHSALADILSWRLMNDVSPDSEKDRVLALTSIDTAVHSARNEAYVLTNAGTALCRLGEYDRGIALCERAVKLAPSTSTKDHLAMSLCFSGMPERAIPLYEEIRSTIPAGRAFPYGRLAVALTQTGRLREALTMADLSVGSAPMDYYGWIVRANLLALENRLDEARRDVARARELFPKLDIGRVADGTDRAYGRTKQQRDWVTGGLRSLV
ncbi:MAG: toll/interleukin-1 receptor domain-containing protein, partial [Pseudomonadales bacterium]